MNRLWISAFVLVSSWVSAQDAPDRRQDFLNFVRKQSVAMREHDRAPRTIDEWNMQQATLRRNLLDSWGGFPEQPCELLPKKIGELQRDGYRIEKIIFQTRPEVWMTANAYVPALPGKLPAVLCVHGHWRVAKQDPVVQSRCIGLAKHGFFVLVVDAFGAGERGIGESLGEYHGEMTGATLFPIGIPLSGLQVYENMRAVDYLQSRPEVDATKIGITGASGGGNQTMYAGAWDARFGAFVPVCSVGTYQSYLGAACCMCEVVPGALRYTEEWALLALGAPRGVMVINATRDAPQFSVAESKRSIESALPVFRLHDREANLKHAIFESPHDYSRPMREAVYGWMKLHLSREGDGSPLAEPAFQTEDPEELRCFPGDSRPDDFVTIPRFAAREARKLLAKREMPADPENWKTRSSQARMTIRDKTFGGDPSKKSEAAIQSNVETNGARKIEFESEPGLTLTARQQEPLAGRVALVLDLDGAELAAKHAISQELQRSGWSVVTVDLRATGALAHPSDKIGRAPDHNSAEWAMWIGRPLLGQWVWDVRRTLDAIGVASGTSVSEATVIGVGPAGLVAICAAALDDRIQRVAAVNMLGSYVTEVPYEKQRLGILAPGILRDVGDVTHLVSLVAPHRVVLAGGLNSDGNPMPAAQFQSTHQPAHAVWKLLNAEAQLRFVEPDDAPGIVAALK